MEGIEKRSASADVCVSEVSSVLHDYYNGALGWNDSNDLNKYVFNMAIDRWTERPQLGDGYNERLLKLYDALIWTVVENFKEYRKSLIDTIKSQEKRRQKKDDFMFFPIADSRPALEDLDDFINTWKYQGIIYRVIDCHIDKVKYHGKIASWTDDINAFSDFNHLSKSQEYTFLIGDTKNEWGFDVNKYRDNIDVKHIYTEHESEIIFPMKRKYVIDSFYGTYADFVEYVNKHNYV